MRSVPVLQPLPDRISTFRVLGGDPREPGLIGYLRQHDADVWIARTLGSDVSAADIRRFREPTAATTWLLDKAQSPLPTKCQPRQAAA